MRVIVMTKRLLTPACLALTLSASALVGCGLGTDNGKPSVIAAFYPFEFVAEHVGGNTTTVTNLTKPGTEPHDIELKPRQVADIVDADIVIYLSGFQPAIDDAVTEHNPEAGFNTADTTQLITGSVPSSEHARSELDTDGEQKDLHVWLDPLRLATIGDKLAKRLAETDTGNAAQYRNAATQLRSQLEQLDAEYTTGLAHCDSRTFVVSHNAFGYLAERYNLNQIAISGLDPENEPSPGRLAEVTKLAREHNAKTIFFETLAGPDIAQAVATQIDADTAVLDPIESIPDGSDKTYLTLMRANLEQLRTALGCH